MNIKNYLKGIGVGIIVASLILIIAGKLNNNTMSDEDVIKRAKELGMVESTTLTAPSGNTGLVDVNTSEEKSEAVVTEDDKTKEDSVNTDQTDTNETADNSETVSGTDKEDKTNTSEKKDAADNKTSTDDTDKKTDATDKTTADNNTDTSADSKTDTKTATDTKKTVSGETVKVEVKSGMSSESAAAAAKDAGLVDDDVEFNKYLCANGYDKRLRVGQYDIPTGSDFETIAKFLCGEQ
ncbi:MAG: hypothetical protein J5515_04795 [Lachnospiraceae bacterium]|nr:hypothetical protein [Lachnospiraceae bacterium]